nr:60-62 kDa protein [Kaumoebavirus]
MSKKGDKKLKKFCGVDKYLKQEHPELYDAFDAVCMSNILKASKITLLLPDAGYRQKIIDAVYSDETNKGTTMVKSLIIPFSLPTGKDFEANKGSLVNLNHHKLNFTSASNDKVTFGEFEIAVNKEFKVMNEDKTNSAIWNVVKGEVPLSGEVVEGKVKFVKRGGAYNPDYENNDLCQHARLMEHRYKEYMTSPQRREMVDPYLEAMVGLLKCAEAKHRQVFDYLICSLDPSPMIAYYTLVVPYRNGESVLGSACVHDWLNSTVMANAKMEYERYLNVCKVPALGYAAQWRKGRLESIGKELGKEVVALYQAVSSTGLFAQNRLLSVGAVAVYKNYPDLKLWQDESRFLLGSYLGDLRELYNSSDVNLIKKELSNLFDYVRHSHTGDNFTGELKLVKIGSDKIVSNAEFYEGLCRFVCSTDFLYHSISRASAEKVKSLSAVVSDWKCDFKSIYNTFEEKFENLALSASIEAPIYQSGRPSKSQIDALYK